MVMVPRLEACAAGESKGTCYVTYSTHEAAAVAMNTLHGVEWPPLAPPGCLWRPPLAPASWHV
jgi:hypothetical protein